MSDTAVAAERAALAADTARQALVHVGEARAELAEAREIAGRICCGSSAEIRVLALRLATINTQLALAEQAIGDTRLALALAREES